jgi:dTDP-4-dehydrorhamnose reductase
MRILLIGGTGQLGGDLLRHNPGHEIAAPGREELDIAHPEELRAALARFRPELVINCAAFHNVPLCEEQPELAFKVNCVAVRDLAAACPDIGARLITFSSDYVFGGDKRTPYAEDDLPQPLQVYGITRLAGEHAALATAPAHAIVIRTCGLYGESGARSKGGNFVDSRVADAVAGKTIEMAAEQTVAPTSTTDLSKAVLALAAHPSLRPGIYHLVNEGQCSWYELTASIVEILGLPTKVVPVDRGGRTGAMRRPLYSVLANYKARRLGITLPSWRDALERYLRSKHAPIASKGRA